MWKMIRLEWKKNDIRKYVGGAVLLAVLLNLFLYAMAFLGIANDPDGTLDAAEGMEMISSSVEMLTGMAFLIFTSVMLASFIVSAYQNKTMNLMFSYPIRRRRILVSQMAAVWIFNYVALTVTKLLVYTCIYVGAQRMQSSFVIDFHMERMSFYVQLFIKSGVTVSMSFIALFAGLAMKSSKAAIVASFVLIFLTQANVGDFTLRGNAVLPMVLTAVSFLFAGLSVCRVEQRDV